MSGNTNVLVGRERELAQLDEFVTRVRCGRGVAAFVEGSAGIGKTALLDAAAERSARAGLSVFHATGAPLEQDFAFCVVRQLFGSVVASAGLLDGAAKLAAIPLGFVTPGGNDAGGWGDPAAAAMHGLHWLTVSLAERAPLLLV